MLYFRFGYPLPEVRPAAGLYSENCCLTVSTLHVRTTWWVGRQYMHVSIRRNNTVTVSTLTSRPSVQHGGWAGNTCMCQSDVIIQ